MELGHFLKKKIIMIIIKMTQIYISLNTVVSMISIWFSYGILISCSNIF